MALIRRHSLALTVAALALAALVLFVWSEFSYFCDQQSQWNEVLRAVHGQPQPCPSFWSRDHMHDLLYNAASNWQSELLFGILLVLILKDDFGMTEGD